MNRKQLVKGYVVTVLSAVIFGCMPMMAKFIYSDGVNSLSLVLLRNLLSLPVAGLIAFSRNRSLRIPVKAVPQLATIGFVGCCLTPTLLFSSYFFIASGTATVFHFAYPAVVVLGAPLLFRERLTAGNLISVLVCVSGVALFYTPGQPLDWRGSALALLSSVTFAAYVLLLSRFRYKQLDGYLLNFYIFGFNVIIMLAACSLTGMLTLPTSLGSWLGCFLFAFLTNVMATAMFQQGTFLIGGQKASILSTLEPITGVVMGILVFREAVSLRTALGAVLVILAGVLIVMFDVHEQKKQAAKDSCDCPADVV